MRYLQSVGERMFWNVQLVGQSTDQIRALHPGLEPKSKAPITVACSYYLYMGKPSIIWSIRGLWGMITTLEPLIINKGPIGWLVHVKNKLIGHFGSNDYLTEGQYKDKTNIALDRCLSTKWTLAKWRGAFNASCFECHCRRRRRRRRRHRHHQR